MVARPGRIPLPRAEALVWRQLPRHAGALGGGRVPVCDPGVPDPGRSRVPHAVDVLVPGPRSYGPAGAPGREGQTRGRADRAGRVIRVRRGRWRGRGR